MVLMMCGISHETASVEEREKLALSVQETLEFLPRLYVVKEISECCVVSTCNRTEVYFVCDDSFSPESAIDFLLDYRKVEDGNLRRLFYCFKSTDAARRLFEVASGLKSQVLGENQILRQVKDAYSLSIRAKTTGPYLNRLFHQAFGVGKKVRSMTNIGAGAVSISSAAVQMVSYVYDKLSDKSVLLIGAGEMGEIAARLLLERGIFSLKIANRTVENAQRMAKELNAQVANFGEIAKEFFVSDIVITATSSPECIITKKGLLPFCGTVSKKTIAIDIAIPRNIEPAVSALANVFLYDMDDLKSIVDKNMEERRRAVPHAEKIITKASEEYKSWMNGQRVVPTIKYLQGKFEDIRASEMERMKLCEGCHKRHELDNITKRIIKKILTAPITKLMSDTNCSEEELKYLRGIFSGDFNEK